MKQAGVDTKLYTPHTARHTSASKHANHFETISELLCIGQWKQTSTFFRYYLCKTKNSSARDSGEQQVETVLTHAHRSLPAIHKVANFKLQNALQKARTAQKKFNIPRRVSFMDVPLRKMGSPE